MLKKIAIYLIGVVMLVPGWALASEKENLFATVESLKIQRQGYTLCAVLTAEQQAFARENLREANSDRIYKFQDQGLSIVADKESHRVLVMYEQFDNASQEMVQNLVGDLFMTYEDPTVSAHDQVVYWAWGKKEKFTPEQFAMAKEKNTPLAIMATVKLNSDIKIMEKTGAAAKGSAYYIISSDPLLQFFQD